MRYICTIAGKYSQRLFILFLLVTGTFKSYGVIDTLRSYDPASATTGSYAGFVLYAGRFIPPAPGYIKSILLTVAGAATSGSVTVHIYGEEGGTPSPTLQKDLITPIVAQKTARGRQTITVTLTDPLYIDNSQFFVGLTDLSGVSILNDTYVHPVSCSSTTGGDYHFQYYKNAGDTMYYDSHAFLFDVIMDYDYSASPNYYKDVTLEAGIDTGISGRSIAWGDFNKDGYEDFIAGGRLYKNNGNGTFTDVSVSSGVNTWATMNAFVDMNNDGWLDILIVQDYTKDMIYINNGNETFTEHDLTGMPIDTTTTCFSIADINNDKYPDLFLGQIWYTYPDPLPNYLFTNDQNLGFTNVSSLLYPNHERIQTYGCMFADYDNDGDPDLYVANYYLQRDELWRNNGDGTFTNVIADKGMDINSQGGSGHGTGVDWADYDNDGDLDMILPMLAHPPFMQQYDHRSTTLYRNDGPPDYNFTDLIGQQLNNPGLAGQGIEYEETQAGGEFGDIDNDGLQDIFLTTYYGCRYAKLYIQKPDHTFGMKTYDYGLEGLVHAPDAVFADFDNDGKLDIATGVEDGHFRLFRNTSHFDGNFIEIDVKSTSENTFGIGARVTVYCGVNKFTREVNAGQGEGMQKPYRLHFGLGNNWTIDSVTVKWPYHTATEKFSGISVNHLYTLIEGGQVVQGIENLKAIGEDFAVSPNPFSSELIVNYNLKAPADVKIEVYSLLGQKVKTLVKMHQSPGYHQVSWNGVDEAGNLLPVGLYMVYLKSGETVLTKKVVKN